jgi:hypothetical protein
MKSKEKAERESDRLWHSGVYIGSVSSEEMKKIKKTFHKSLKEDMDFNCKKCNKKISAHNKDWHDCMCDKCFNETHFSEKKPENKKTKKIFMKPGKTNEEDRINFIKFWANYVKTHEDEEWSEQQNIIVDSQIQD